MSNARGRHARKAHLQLEILEGRALPATLLGLRSALPILQPATIVLAPPPPVVAPVEPAPTQTQDQTPPQTQDKPPMPPPSAIEFVKECDPPADEPPTERPAPADPRVAVASISIVPDLSKLISPYKGNQSNTHEESGFEFVKECDPDNGPQPVPTLPVIWAEVALPFNRLLDQPTELDLPPQKDLTPKEDPRTPPILENQVNIDRSEFPVVTNRDNNLDLNYVSPSLNNEITLGGESPIFNLGSPNDPVHPGLEKTNQQPKIPFQLRIIVLGYVEAPDGAGKQKVRFEFNAPELSDSSVNGTFTAWRYVNGVRSGEPIETTFDYGRASLELDMEEGVVYSLDYSGDHIHDAWHVDDIEELLPRNDRANPDDFIENSNVGLNDGNTTIFGNETLDLPRVANLPSLIKPTRNTALNDLPTVNFQAKEINTFNVLPVGDLSLLPPKKEVNSSIFDDKTGLSPFGKTPVLRAGECLPEVTPINPFVPVIADISDLSNTAPRDGIRGRGNVPVDLSGFAPGSLDLRRGEPETPEDGVQTNLETNRDRTEIPFSVRATVVGQIDYQGTQLTRLRFEFFVPETSTKKPTGKIVIPVYIDGKYAGWDYVAGFNNGRAVIELLVGGSWNYSASYAGDDAFSAWEIENLEELLPRGDRDTQGDSKGNQQVGLNGGNSVVFGNETVGLPRVVNLPSLNEPTRNTTLNDMPDINFQAVDLNTFQVLPTGDLSLLPPGKDGDSGSHSGDTGISPFGKLPDRWTDAFAPQVPLANLDLAFALYRGSF